MGAVTYPNAAVYEFVNDSFVAFQVNTKETTAETRELLRRYRLLWDPGLVVLDSRGTEIRRWVGYTPPAEFIAELQVALAKVDLLHLRHRDALERLRSVADASPTPAVAPEALYWAGIAQFRLHDNDLDALGRVWSELATRFPASTWWTRADVLDQEL